MKPPFNPRLLGPSRPEVGCDECFDHLDRYVEASLDPGTGFDLCPTCVSPRDCLSDRHCLGMRAHLEGCPACAEEYASLRALLQSSDEPPSRR